MSILKRTIIMDQSKGQVRFYDWVRVTTTIGPMVEPRQFGKLLQTSTATTGYDPQDILAKINDVDQMDILRQKESFFGDGLCLHGGEQLPTSYHYNP